MALINCPECAKEVSDKAEKCISRVLLYVSLIIMFIGALTRPGVPIFGVILLIIAIAISITAKTSKWWDHD